MDWKVVAQEVRNWLESHPKYAGFWSNVSTETWSAVNDPCNGWVHRKFLIVPDPVHCFKTAPDINGLYAPVSGWRQFISGYLNTADKFIIRRCDDEPNEVAQDPLKPDPILLKEYPYIGIRLHVREAVVTQDLALS